MKALSPYMECVNASLERSLPPELWRHWVDTNSLRRIVYNNASRWFPEQRDAMAVALTDLWYKYGREHALKPSNRFIAGLPGVCAFYGLEYLRWLVLCGLGMEDPQRERANDVLKFADTQAPNYGRDPVSWRLQNFGNGPLAPTMVRFDGDLRSIAYCFANCLPSESVKYYVAFFDNNAAALMTKCVHLWCERLPISGRIIW